MSIMLGDVKNKVVELGYVLVHYTEDGMSFVNEDLKTCLITLKNYDKSHLLMDSELRKPLEKYSFSEKGTICIFTNSVESIEELERNEYHALKVHASHMDCIPSRKENITVKFSPVNSSNEFIEAFFNEKVGYTISPFIKVDGLACQEFYKYLNQAKDGDLIKYPSILEGSMTLSWFRYIAGKFYNVET